MTLAGDEKCEILCLDEPDTHMHDDMLRVFVNELVELKNTNSKAIIIVASHSTSLIEQLAAFGSENVHILTFDENRRVGNSENDLEVINALHRNGVRFSHLMLSKKKNIFIENNHERGKQHKDFFLKFFQSDELPNIISIGTSGNVNDSNTFAEIFKDLLNMDKINSFGVQDGDIWMKSMLADYLTNKLNIDQFIATLENYSDIYIPNESNYNAFYFNCWEIENFYLMDEVLECWKHKDGQPLTKMKFKEFLIKKRSIIFDQYLDTFYKMITRVRVAKTSSFIEFRNYLNTRFSEINEHLARPDELENRMNVLIDSMLHRELFHWVPGKETRNALINDGYVFNDSDFDFKSSQLAFKIGALKAH